MSMPWKTFNILTSQEEQELLDLIASEVKSALFRVVDYYTKKLRRENEAGKSTINDSSLRNLKPGSIWFMSFIKKHNLWKNVEALLASGEAQLSPSTLTRISELEETFITDYENSQKRLKGKLNLDKVNEPQIRNGFDSSDRISEANCNSGIKESDFNPLELLACSKDSSLKTNSSDVEQVSFKEEACSQDAKDSGNDAARSDPAISLREFLLCIKDTGGSTGDTGDSARIAENSAASSPSAEHGDEGSKVVSDMNRSYTCPECGYQSNYREMKNHLKHALEGTRDVRKCEECDFVTKYESCYEEHLRTHRNSETTELNEPQCDSVASTVETMEELDEEKDSDPDLYMCSKCSYTSKKLTLFRRHVAKHKVKVKKKTGKGLLCTYCNYIASSRSDLSVHINSHQQPLRCNECEFSTFKKMGYKRHVTMHVNEKKRLENPEKQKVRKRGRKCKYCNFQSTYRGELKEHLKSHVQPLKCELCSYTTFKKQFLKRHAVVHSDERPFPCKSCQYSSKTKTELKRHELTHSTTLAFHCTVCSYGTNKRSMLKAHLASHAGEYKHKCQLCSYGTNVLAGLKSHMISHSEDRPYGCPEIDCNYETKRKKSLEMHMLVHTKEKKFFCTQYGCNYGTNYKKDLNAHILNHGTEKMFRCEACNYGTNLKSNLNLHRKHCKNRPAEEREAAYANSVPKSNPNLHCKRNRSKPVNHPPPTYSSPPTTSYASPTYMPNVPNFPMAAHMGMPMAPMWYNL